MALGRLAPSVPGPASFPTILKLQGGGTRALYCELAIDGAAFAYLYGRLVDVAVQTLAPPEWATGASRKPLYSGALVQACENSKTCKDQHVGRGGIRVVLQGELTQGEIFAVEERVRGLLAASKGNKGGVGGRCHMNLVVEKVLRMRGGADAARAAFPAYGRDSPAEHLEEIVALARRQLSPKLFCWTWAELVEMGRQLIALGWALGAQETDALKALQNLVKAEPATTVKAEAPFNADGNAAGSRAREAPPKSRRQHKSARAR